jgi:hypothetical protein
MNEFDLKADFPRLLHLADLVDDWLDDGKDSDWISNTIVELYKADPHLAMWVSWEALMFMQKMVKLLGEVSEELDENAKR